MTDNSRILWPEGIDPSGFPVHSYNKLFIPAPAEKIWPHLVAAPQWPEWYDNCKWMKILDGGNTLRENTRFIWKTFGMKISSQVKIFRPFEHLGWDARGFASHGFHGWRLIPQDGGTLVVTEEVQGGFGPHLIGHLVLKGLQTQHQKWLEGLAQKTQQ